MPTSRNVPFLGLIRGVALALNSISLLLSLYALLIQPHWLTFSLAIGFGLAIFSVLARQQAWITAMAVVFCLFVGVVSAVAASSLWFSSAWFESPTARAVSLGTLFVFGAIGPLANVYALYGVWSGPRED